MTIMKTLTTALVATLMLGAASAAMAERSGEAIYNNYCTACHQTGAAGAPKLDATSEWQSRLDEKGRDTLYQHSINGFNAMPPKGTCSDCSDAEMKVAVDYMLEEALK